MIEYIKKRKKLIGALLEKLYLSVELHQASNRSCSGMVMPLQDRLMGTANKDGTKEIIKLYIFIIRSNIRRENYKYV